ncbi:ATP-dependent RNA helicase RhlB, partial [Lysobacter sp.]|uniref:ATP-dependent RNA helicase RhlB n=1 Tax=Lysobacter sp. TaxID=72226 RepID=UPI002D23A923
ASAADTERAPRKRRRRRGGRRIEGAEGATAPAAAAPQKPRQPTQVHAQKSGAKPDGDKLGLLHRIGRGLKSLISRSPRSQH